MRQRKAQQPQIKLIAKTPQHPLPERALVCVDAVFERAIDQHGRQKRAAQQQQVRHPLEFEAEYYCGNFASARIAWLVIVFGRSSET